MASPRPRILASYFHTPAADSQRLFHTVLRAGHVRASPDYGVERRSYPGHDLLFCVTGSGFVRCDEKIAMVPSGHMAWIDCGQPHAHWADPHQPWELLWLRIDGKPSELCADALGVRDNPIFRLRKDTAAKFGEIFKLLQERPLAVDAALHAIVASLIALLFEARLIDAADGEQLSPDGPGDPRLKATIARMRSNYRKRWSVEELAKLSGLSVPHFFRRFRKATGSSPLDWLRRERINQAKRRLGESADPIREIAVQVGYADPFYFSRDFKKLVGLSPKHYRQQEAASSKILE